MNHHLTQGACPAYPLNIIIEGLITIGIPKRKAELLETDETFTSLLFRNHQIARMNEFFNHELHIQLTRKQLAQIFNVKLQIIDRANRIGINTISPPGRHNALDTNIEAEILTWINDRSASSIHVTRSQLLHYVSESYKLPITKGWVNSFIGRHLEELAEVKSYPQESTRLCVPREFLEKTVMNLREQVHDRVAELVFNLDEVGCGEWEDRQSKKVIVPKQLENCTIHHKIDRSQKHITIITCVSAAGSHCVPYIVTSVTVPPSLLLSGLRIGKDVVFKQNSKPYVDSKTFIDFLLTVFFPALASTRAELNLPNDEAVLLMDNCGSHIKPEIIDLLTAEKIRVITFAPHTTNIFQMLDVSFFGIFKRKKSQFFETEDGPKVYLQLMKLLHCFYESANWFTITGSFKKVGILINATETPHTLIFDETKMRNSDSFLELWNINFPFEKLSSRRQAANFGFLNEFSFRNFIPVD
jgi:hypothetical protein